MSILSDRAMSPAQIIRKARKDAGLTQQGLADLLGEDGVTVGTVTRWESGTIDPPSSRMRQAVEACGRALTLTKDDAEIGRLWADHTRLLTGLRRILVKSHSWSHEETVDELRQVLRTRPETASEP